tara:strand:+ start:1690 stop:2643 length:954 start_codon:yes stop_codon:yes gene_type:complete
MPEESGEVTAEQLLAAASEYDNAVAVGETPEVEIQTEEPKEEVQDESPPEPAEETVQEPETEVLNSTEDNADKQVSSLTEGEAPEAQEQPKKSKWEKNEERKASSWKQINAEKEEIKRQREALLKEAEELKSRKVDLDEGKAYRDEKGFTAEDYENAAKRLKEEGDDDLASDAIDRAKEVRAEGDKVQQQMVAKKHWDAFESKRQELMQKHSELSKPDSELTQKANAILTEHPSMQSAVGLEQAVKIAQLQIKAASAESSEAQVKELTDKLTKLEKKMSVNGGFTNERVDGERSFDDLSEEEQTEYLRRAAMEADNA